MATLRIIPDFPQLLLPKEVFLSSETELRLLLLGNLVGLYICLEWIFVAEERCGDPLCVLCWIPLPQN